MNIKKLILPLVILIGAMSLAACNDESKDTKQAATTPSTSTVDKTPDAVQPKSSTAQQPQSESNTVMPAGDDSSMAQPSSDNSDSTTN